MDTFAEVVRRHARQQSAGIACVFLPDGEGDGHTLTFGELDARARALASVLHARGAAGQPVLVLCPAGLDYAVALVACFYAGAIAVPAYPPSRVSLARTLPRVLAICEDCRPAAAIATRAVSEVLRASAALAQVVSQLELILADDLVPRRGIGADRAATVLPASAAPLPDSPALLQYTSGSTGEPRGVLLTHRQILANHEMIRCSGDMSGAEVFLSWLPPYHDMGLIGGVLQPLYLGVRAVLMPPDAFIRKPRRWLTAAQRHRATILLAPNFAFDVCVQRIAAEERAGLDLSSWRVVYNGAEPIQAATLNAFAQAFQPCGFRPSAFYPCYGMAEATLIVSGGPAGAAPTIRAYDADALERDRAVAPAAGGAETSRSNKLRRLVGCGRALLDEQIVIVDPASRGVLGPGSVGEIWVKSRSVGSGYWNRPEETAATFGAFTSDTGEGPFLRTGDLGFFDAGELFVTGRLKDLIIVRGLNHYPHDIERTSQAVHPALVANAGAAFAVESHSGEQLVLVQEFDKRAGVEPEPLLSQISQAVRDVHDVSPHAIVLIRRGTLPKTSSGKVQRRSAKAAFVAGRLQVVASFRTPRSTAVTAHERPQAASLSEPPRTHTREVTRRTLGLADWMREHLAAKLGVDADAIDPREPLARYGVDSLVAAELTEELERLLGIELPSTISYDNPSIAELARALSEPVRGRERPRRLTPGLTAQSASHDEDPIAIVGMACRFPGAPDLAGFWSLLQGGVDAITEVPRARWDVDAIYHPVPGTPGKMCSRFGGFVDDIDRFDAAFFGIPPHEAARIDPQQRLFLEVAWEALEDAGQSPADLAGSSSGVFAGVCTSDYATLYGGDLHMIDGDYGTGAAPSLVANRLSYLLDLKGPSETVDTACSSALVALQHACQSLRANQCELAIVGGVNAVLAPESSVYFSQVRALASDGRCKSFDRSADGFVRSEGAGAVVLKPLSRALADGDRLYALIAGCSVNHDGRSNGLLAPSGAAQQAVVRRALSAAGIAPEDLDYIEAHGVGTKVADAVEMRAIAGLMGARPPQHLLRVGSAKTNVGHLEAASGMVGLIKVALALHHEELPAHLHLRDPHPDLGIAGLPIEIPTAPSAWRRSERPRFAGVSAFGFGGTNAHVVLREAPIAKRGDSGIERSEHVFALSAKTASALRTLATRMAARVGQAPAAQLADVCFTANVGRAHFDHRLAIVCGSTAELRDALLTWVHRPAAALQLQSTPPGLHAGHVVPGAHLDVGFAFLEAEVPSDTARGLHRGLPQFEQALDRCNEVLHPHLEVPLLDLLYGGDCPERAALRARPSHAHAAVVALHCALHAVWRGLGVEPAAVYGAGAGEYAAAAAAGVLTWEQALVLAARRGLVLEGLAAGAQQYLSVRALKQELASIDYVAPTLPLVSASLGRAFEPGEVPDAQHWGRHLYHAPSPADACAALAAQGCNAHIELGPPLPDAAKPAVRNWLPSLGRDGADLRCLLETLGALYACGAAIDWRAFDAAYLRRKLSLPTYPFERERHWLDFPERALGQSAASVIDQPSTHPLISRVRIHVPERSGFVRKRRASEGGTGS